MRVLLLILFTFLNYSAAFDEKEFYHSFESKNLPDINKCIQQLESAEQTSKIKVYRGALLMKKAGLEQKPALKLNYFKQGHQLLETEIAKIPENAEYRLIRLIVQESAPDILKYKKNIPEDKAIVVTNFKTMDSLLQDYIIRYCKQSKVLTLKEIQ